MPVQNNDLTSDQSIANDIQNNEEICKAK